MAYFKQFAGPFAPQSRSPGSVFPYAGAPVAVGGVVPQRTAGPFGGQFSPWASPRRSVPVGSWGVAGRRPVMSPFAGQMGAGVKQWPQLPTDVHVGPGGQWIGPPLGPPGQWAPQSGVAPHFQGAPSAPLALQILAALAAANPGSFGVFPGLGPQHGAFGQQPVTL